MSDVFYEKVEKMFSEKLQYQEIPTIRIKNLKENKILENINYSFIRFDSNLNIYKMQNDGNWTIVNNPLFKAVLVFK
ncbi:MAG: hypothetical protein WC466_09735 [Candidatus Izemoplasmatales bacterium]